MDPGNVKRRYGIHQCLPVVLFMGRMAYQKESHLLVEAAARVLKKNNAQFVIIREGECALTVNIKIRSFELAIPATFLGYAPDDIVIDWFIHVTLCVYLAEMSLSELLCLKLGMQGNQ